MGLFDEDSGWGMGARMKSAMGMAQAQAAAMVAALYAGTVSPGQPVYGLPFTVTVSGVPGDVRFGRVWVAVAPAIGRHASAGWHLWGEVPLNGQSAYSVRVPTTEDYFPGYVLDIAAEYTGGSSGHEVLATGVPGQGGFTPSLLAQVQVGPPGTVQSQGMGLMGVGLLVAVGGLAYLASQRSKKLIMIQK